MTKKQNTDTEIKIKNDETLEQRLDVLKICANSFIENKDFKHAEEYYLEMLELDEDCFDAYLGLLLVDTKSADVNELFGYYMSQGMDADSKVSTAIKELYDIRMKSLDKSSPSYQKFIFNTYRTIKGMYDDYISRKDETYERCIEEYENTSDVAILKKLIEQFEALNNYKESAVYISRCRDKINNQNELMEENAKNEKLNNLLTCARDFLKSGDYRLAEDYFEEALQLDADNCEAYLGLLMVDTQTENIDDLFEYYRSLYDQDETEILEACKKDTKHINEMVSKYSVPSYLDPDTIRGYYDFDNSYISVLNSRKRNSEEILEELTINPAFVKIAQTDDARYQEIMKEILGAYQERVREAEELDEENVEIISKQYEQFLSDTDQLIEKLYKESKEKSDARKREERIKLEARKEQRKADAAMRSERVAEAYALLDEQRYEEAKQLLEELVKNDPDDSMIYLGMILADIHKTDIDGLVDYYIHLHDEEKTEILVACPEETEHIREMVDRYASDDKEKAAELEKAYAFDRSYQSILNSRIMAKHDLYNDIYQNNYFINLDRLGDPEIISRLETIVDAYDARVDEAQKADDRRVAEITRDYRDHISAVDQQIVSGNRERQDEISRQKKERSRRITNNILKVAGALILIAVLAYVGYLRILVPSSRYKEAVALMESENYEEAIAIFKELNGFRDSETKIDDAYYEIAMKKLEEGEVVEALNILNSLNIVGIEDTVKELRQQLMENMEVGNTVVFGEYEQDGDSSNGREMLEWIVLDVEEDRALLISKYVIDAYRFDSSLETIYWENSEIRFWLNEIFVGNAFYQESPSDILPATVISHYLDEDPDDDIEADAYETTDRLFLLSIDEVERYYPTEQTRTVMATQAVRNGEVLLEDDGHSGWWLRDAGEDGTTYYIWGYDGSIVTSMNSIMQGIRPAMWIRRP
jgi:TolA-binding protein